MEPLVALVPESNLALTTETASTLWFHLPEVSPSRQLEFKLYDPSGNVYETYLETPQTAGLVGVDLAHLMRTAGAPTMQPGQAYRWTFAIVCDPENRAEDYWVQGWTEQVEARAVEASLTSDLLLSVDAFTTQAQSAPQAYDLMGQWQGLVRTMGLEQTLPTALTRAPILLQPPSTTDAELSASIRPSDLQAD